MSCAEARLATGMPSLGAAAAGELGRSAPLSFSNMDAVDVFRLMSDFETCKSDWDLFTQLYLSGAPRVGSLNKISGLFFGRLQRNLIENTIIRLSRLTDPDIQGPYRNLTLESLKRDAKKTFGVRQKYKAIVKAVAVIREYRDKMFAHKDFEVAQQIDPSTKLGRLVYNHITHAIEIIEAFINDYCALKGYDPLRYPTPVDVVALIKSFRGA